MASHNLMRRLTGALVGTPCKPLTPGVPTQARAESVPYQLDRTGSYTFGMLMSKVFQTPDR